MSGSLPTNVGFSTVGLKSNHRTLRSESQSGKRQVRKVGAHKWSFTASYPPMSRSDFMPIYAFMVSQQGMYGSFTVVPPDLAVPQGIATGSPKVVGVHAAGDSTILIGGFTGGVTGIMKAGDIVRFANHNKVYMVVADANTDGDGLEGYLVLNDSVGADDGDKILLEPLDGTSALKIETGGTTTLSIEPPLVAEITDGLQLVMNNVAFTVEMKNDVQSYNVSAPIIYSYEIDLVEILGG